MNTKISTLTSALMLAILTTQPATAEPTEASVVYNPNSMQHVQWYKSGNTAYQEEVALNLPNNETNLIFVRPLDADGIDTSANIAIDDRFQVSLQPGHYSQIRYCSGVHKIDIATTETNLNNFELATSYQVDFPAQQNNYIYVDVDDSTKQPQLSKLTPEYAKELISSYPEQTHQISRVQRNCPEVVVPEPVIKVEIDKPINLEVLFEFDKAIVQPVFNQRIEAVANFMKKYPNTTTLIEGHTDSIGNDSYNMDLSQRRAEAVKQELVNKYGIDATRLNTQGFGETRPVATNATKQGRYKNRRVVATVSATE